MTRVTVGIPTLNGPDRLDRCLRSIAQYTDFSLFDSVKVLVCDNASREENRKLNKDCIHRAEQLREHAGLEMLMPDVNRGVAAAWNMLVRHQSADVIVLTNDDIEVVQDWLNVLVFSVVNNPKAGMVGLDSYPGVVKQDLMAADRIPLRNSYREAQLLDGGGNLLASHGPIFAFRRDAYDAVGGFDERYYCFFEEVDFGISLRRSGYMHYMASYPIVYHMGGATTSDPRNMDAAAHMAKSRQLFIEKWGASPKHLRESYANEPGVREWNSQLEDWK